MGVKTKFQLLASRFSAKFERGLKDLRVVSTLVMYLDSVQLRTVNFNAQSNSETFQC